jgi:hypothetical protein
MLVLLISQLDHFGFVPVSSPQTAGVACSLTVYAYDAGNNIVDTSLSVSLFASPGPQYGNLQIFISHGVWQGLFTAYLADTYAIRCLDYGSHSGQSNQIIFNPNTPYRLLTILPGQNYYPGIDTGKTGAPIAQQAGTEFAVNVYLTDRWCNRIPGVTDSVVSATPDNFKSSVYFRLSNGAYTFNYSFRTAANQRFYLRDASNPTIKADTSSQIYIYAGAYARPLVLLPGEIHLPGDDTIDVNYTPGKLGHPAPQYLGEDFTVRVYAVDSMWNTTQTNGNMIHIIADSISNTPDQPYSNGSVWFILHFKKVDDNQPLQVQDLTTGIYSYISYLDILAKTDSMAIAIIPDTISAGDTAQIRVTLYDRYRSVIPNRRVIFTILRGHGEIPALYDTMNTNDMGVAFSYFTATSGFFNELDTIGLTADDTTFFGECYVRFPDSTVMGGNIIAYPNPIGIRADHTRLIYYLNQNCDITYAIYDPFGNMVHRETIVSGQPGAHVGVNYLTWNGYNDKRVRVASGLYYVMLKGYVNTSVFLEKRIKVGVIW